MQRGVVAICDGADNMMQSLDINGERGTTILCMMK